MQKRNLVIFSLLLISILIISGCNAAVGGVRSGSAKQQPYQIRESESILTAGGCPWVTNQPIRIEGVDDFYGNGNCYRIVGCKVKTVTNYYGNSVQITNKDSSKEYVAQIYPESNPQYCGQQFTALRQNQVEHRDILKEGMNFNPYSGSPIPGSGSN